MSRQLSLLKVLVSLRVWSKVGIGMIRTSETAIDLGGRFGLTMLSLGWTNSRLASKASQDLETLTFSELECYRSCNRSASTLEVQSRRARFHICAYFVRLASSNSCEARLYYRPELNKRNVRVCCSGTPYKPLLLETRSLLQMKVQNINRTSFVVQQTLRLSSERQCLTS